MASNAQSPVSNLVKVATVGYDGLSKALKETFQHGGQVEIKSPTIDLTVDTGIADLLARIPREGIGYEEKDQRELMKVARVLLDELLSSGLMHRDGSRVKLAPAALTCSYTVRAYSTK